MFTADVGSARDFATVCFLDHKETYIHVCLAELCRKFSSQPSVSSSASEQTNRPSAGRDRRVLLPSMRLAGALKRNCPRSREAARNG